MAEVLVLGGTGFVGVPLVERLLRAGHEVTVLSRGTQGRLLPDQSRDTLATETTRRACDARWRAGSLMRSSTISHFVEKRSPT